MMAECKDCIHFCVCSPYTSPNESYPEVGGCKCFKHTADVVPKSKIDLYRKQVDELEDELASTYDKFEKAKAEVEREIFEEIEKHIVFNTYGIATISDKTFAEFKKKYKGVNTYETM